MGGAIERCLACNLIVKTFHLNYLSPTPSKVIIMVAIWPFLKQFARNKMILWPFYILMKLVSFRPILAEIL
jgi:hypothetical protein